jgi:hypothetical protein
MNQQVEPRAALGRPGLIQAWLWRAFIVEVAPALL